MYGFITFGKESHKTAQTKTKSSKEAVFVMKNVDTDIFKKSTNNGYFLV